MRQTFQVIATKEEKKNYIMNKIMKLDALSKSVTGSRNTGEALAILDNLSKIGITNQEQQLVNRILKKNSKGFFTFGSRIPSFKYAAETPFQDYYLLNNPSQQQMKTPLYIQSPTDIKMNDKDINQTSFTKQKISDFPNASIGGPPKPNQESLQEMMVRFKERNRQSKLKKKQEQQKMKEKQDKIKLQMNIKRQEQEQKLQLQRKLKQEEKLQLQRKLKQAARIQEQMNIKRQEQELQRKRKQKEELQEKKLQQQRQRKQEIERKAKQLKQKIRRVNPSQSPEFSKAIMQQLNRRRGDIANSYSDSDSDSDDEDAQSSTFQF